MKKRYFLLFIKFAKEAWQRVKNLEEGDKQLYKSKKR